MHYIFQFDIAAIFLSAAILLSYCVRRNYPTRAGQFFKATVACNLITAIADLVSAVFLSYGWAAPLWFHYTINIVYLFFFVLTAITFLGYVTCLAHKRNWALGKGVCTGIVILDAVLLLTTPFTNWVFGFSATGIYFHGPLFVFYQATGFVVLIFALVLLMLNYKILTGYQIAIVVVSDLLAMCAVFFQALFPSVLIESFFISLMATLAALSLEDAAKFMHHKTYCYNATAFESETRRIAQMHQPRNVVAFGFMEISYLHHIMDAAILSNCIDAIASKLVTAFGQRRTFYLGSCRFAIVTDSDPQETKRVIGELQAFFQEPFRTRSVSMYLTPCLSALSCEEFAQAPEEISDAVREALAVLEEQGSATVDRVNGSALARKRREAQIAAAMKRALENDGFEVYYQPIFNPVTERFETAEALVRLIDEELGFVSPEEFIPIAEKNGMIFPIGEVVFKSVFELWEQARLAEKGVRYIEINLSMLQCMYKGTADYLLELMERYGIDPSCMNFEVTETASTVDMDTARSNIKRLIDAGSTFSLDDYGTGYSNASRLITIDISLVKIDKSILWAAMESRKGKDLLANMVSLIKILDKKCVVEGVETEEMAQFLREIDVDYFQGFLYSKPIPASDYVTFLAQHNS